MKLALLGVVSSSSYELSGEYPNPSALSGQPTTASLQVTAGSDNLIIHGTWSPSSRPDFTGTAKFKERVLTWERHTHEQVDCLGPETNPGCLKPTTQGDRGCKVFGSPDPQYEQCSWESVEIAQKQCGLWDDCGGFSCATVEFVDTNTQQFLCNARDRTAVKHGYHPPSKSLKNDDVVYVKSTDTASAAGTTLLGQMSFPDDQDFTFTFSSATGQIDYNSGAVWQHAAPKPPVPPAADCQDCTCQSNNGGWDGTYTDCVLQSRSQCQAGGVGYCVECDSKAEYNGKHYKSECGAPKPSEWTLLAHSDCGGDDVTPAPSCMESAATVDAAKSCCASTAGCGGFNWCPKYRKYGIIKKKDCAQVKSACYSGSACYECSLYLYSGPQPPKPATDSCANYGCGSYSPSAHSCQCDANCKSYGNCCSDYDATCHQPAAGSCTVQGCGSYRRSDACHCDYSCEDYGNCCSDYDSVCPHKNEDSMKPVITLSLE